MKLTVSLCFLMLLVSKAYGLGLGTLEVSSNLDQPLSATIELLLSKGDNSQDIEVLMASSDEFDSSGIDYSAYIEQIKLSLEEIEGNAVINVSSDNVIKEPFIHFLVRVNWPNGSFLREYTALIDPPLYAAKNPQAISEAKVVGDDISYEVEVEEEVIYEPLNYDDAGNIVKEESEEPIAAAAESSVGVVESNDTARYGPIVAGESLGMIAMELQKEFPGLSIYQIMPILLEENPDAFIDNNINGLLKGSVLNISSVERIRNYDVEEGKRFFHEQISNWSPAFNDDELRVSQDSYTENDDLYTDSSFDASEETSANDSDFQVGASTNYDSALSSGDTDASEAEVSALKSELNQLEVSLQSSSLENQDLKERISLLEGQLADMNRLLSLDVESTDLAGVENALANLNTENEQEEIGTDLLTEADEILDLESEDFALVLDDDLDVLDEEQLVIDDLDSALEIVDEGDIETGVQEIEETEAEITEVKSEPAKVVSIQKKSFIDKVKNFLFDNNLWRYLAGLGLVLLGFLGLAAYRKRKAYEEFEVSMMTIDGQTKHSDSIRSSREGLEVPTSLTDAHSQISQQSVVEKIEEASKESSFLTVYSDSDAVVQSDEVDPVAEADVYIAYGRNEQAEEVLINGLESFPDRADIKQKLLSLYHTDGKGEAFERLAEGWYADEDIIDGAVWDEICTMGIDLAPNNPLFSMPSNSISFSSEGEVSKGESSEDESSEDESSEDESSEDESSEDESSEVIVDDVIDIDSDVSGLEIFDTDDIENSAIDIESDSSIELEKFEFDDAIDFDVVDMELSADMAEDDQLELDDVSDLEFEEDYDEAQTQYELAKVFSDLGDGDGAIKILKEIVANADNKEELIEKASKLLETLES